MAFDFDEPLDVVCSTLDELCVLAGTSVVTMLTSPPIVLVKTVVLCGNFPEDDIEEELPVRSFTLVEIVVTGYQLV